MTGIEILGIVGSLRAGSFNHLALKAAQELVPDGAVLDLIELHGIPVFNQDDEVAIPAAVREFKRRVMAANAILFATPDTTTPYQARSRTPSTGPRGPTVRVPGRASRRRFWGPLQAISERRARNTIFGKSSLL